MEDTTNYLPQAFVRWAKTQEDPTLVGGVLLTLLGKDIPLSPKGEAYADVFSLEYTRMQEEMSAKDTRRKEQYRVSQRKTRSKKVAQKTSHVNNVNNVNNTDIQTNITLQTDITNNTNKHNPLPFHGMDCFGHSPRNDEHTSLRHCEERSDDAIQNKAIRKMGNGNGNGEFVDVRGIGTRIRRRRETIYDPQIPVTHLCCAIAGDTQSLNYWRKVQTKLNNDALLRDELYAFQCELDAGESVRNVAAALNARLTRLASGPHHSDLTTCV